MFEAAVWRDQEVDERCAGCLFVNGPGENPRLPIPIATCAIFLYPRREWQRAPVLGCVHAQREMADAHRDPRVRTGY